MSACGHNSTRSFIKRYEKVKWALPAEWLPSCIKAEQCTLPARMRSTKIHPWRLGSFQTSIRQ